MDLGKPKTIIQVNLADLQKLTTNKIKIESESKEVKFYYLNGMDFANDIITVEIIDK